MKLKYYLHNDYEASEIREELMDHHDVPPAIMDNLIEEIYSKFYEVGFDVEVDDKTGNITKISIEEE